MNDDIQKLQELLTLIENGEEILESNLEAIAKLAQKYEYPPEEFEKIFKKRYKDILA